MAEFNYSKQNKFHPFVRIRGFKMKKLSVFITILLFLVLAACKASDNKHTNTMWVIASSADVHEKPDVFSDAIDTVKFGDSVTGLDEKFRFGIPDDWLQIKLPSGKLGYVQIKYLADKTKLEKMDALLDLIETKQAQASGTTGRKAPIRLGPGRDAELIEVMRTPQNFDVYDKVTTTHTHNNREKKEVWYLVKLVDGRAGYIHSLNIKLVPPPDINMYTQGRKAVAWHMLREKEDAESGRKGRDYITAYAGTALSPGADFDRIEIYNYDPKIGAYSTSFAKSGIKGLLPLNVIDTDGGGKIIKVRLMKKNEPGSVTIQEYSFPNPIKMVREYDEKDSTPDT